MGAASPGETVQVDIRLTPRVERHLAFNCLKLFETTYLSKFWFSTANLHPYTPAANIIAELFDGDSDVDDDDDAFLDDDEVGRCRLTSG